MVFPAKAGRSSRKLARDVRDDAVETGAQAPVFGNKLARDVCQQHVGRLLTGKPSTGLDQGTLAIGDEKEKRPRGRNGHVDAMAGGKGVGE